MQPVLAGVVTSVGAFLVAGGLTVLAGLWRPLERAISAIPAPLAGAMLAGVLLPICEGPAHAVVEIPSQAVPVVLVQCVVGLALLGALAGARRSPTTPRATRPS